MKKYLTKQNITKTFQIIILTAIFSIIIIYVDKYNQKQLLEQLRIKPIQSTIITQVRENINSQSQIVYITNYGTKYHNVNCKHLSKSSIQISLEEAISQGYTPCSDCNSLIFNEIINSTHANYPLYKIPYNLYSKQLQMLKILFRLKNFLCQILN